MGLNQNVPEGPTKLNPTLINAQIIIVYNLSSVRPVKDKTLQFTNNIIIYI